MTYHSLIKTTALKLLKAPTFLVVSAALLLHFSFCIRSSPQPISDILWLPRGWPIYISSITPKRNAKMWEDGLDGVDDERVSTLVAESRTGCVSPFFFSLFFIFIFIFLNVNII